MFPELRTQVGADYVAMFEEDHASIHDLLDQAAGKAWASASVELADRLSDHILREESDLFPPPINCSPPTSGPTSMSSAPRRGSIRDPHP